MNSKTTTPPSAETSRWKGHTTHCIDFWYYGFSIVIALDIGFASTVAALPPAVLSCIALIVPVLMWLIRQWFTKCTSRELVAQRLKIGTGFLNRKLDELELFVVKDYAMDQPLFLRLAGLDIKSLVTRNAPPALAMRDIAKIEDVRENSAKPFSLSVAENASTRWMRTAMMKA
jgi:uncharacterized membrane protein YdbT with pleckstrin-like domain